MKIIVGQTDTNLYIGGNEYYNELVSFEDKCKTIRMALIEVFEEYVEDFLDEVESNPSLLEDILDSKETIYMN